LMLRYPHTDKLCMDNAAMIGLVANFKFKRKEFVTDLENLDRKPRWKIGVEL
jgi:tRNA A37 threonylcarbamoyltransferase TsaD